MKYYGSTTVVLPTKRKGKEEEVNRKEIEDKRNRIKDIYNSICTKLPQIQKITEKREKAIDKFVEEFTEQQFKQICEIANNTDFLIGINEKGWKADFDFLMRTDKATSVLEGKYSNEKKKSSSVQIGNKKQNLSNFEQRNYNDFDFSKMYANGGKKW